MNPGLIVKLRPTGPWRIGPDSGARNQVDAIYHSDSLYSAVAHAMSRLGSLDEWLDATARAATPAVCFSSCFPFVQDTAFVTPPRTVWPPSASALTSGRVRWKSARFVPLNIVQDILSGKTLDENRWTLDGPSGCLMPSGKPGPFRTSVRWSAAIDRLSGAAERHSAACLEFRPGAGLWTVASFAEGAARDQWQDRVKAAFRWLADSGFGGERSRGWGRAEAPQFVEGQLPEMILGKRLGSSGPRAGMKAQGPDVFPPMQEPPREDPPVVEPPADDPDVNPPENPPLPDPDPEPALASADEIFSTQRRGDAESHETDVTPGDSDPLPVLEAEVLAPDTDLPLRVEPLAFDAEAESAAEVGAGSEAATAASGDASPVTSEAETKTGAEAQAVQPDAASSASATPGVDARPVASDAKSAPQWLLSLFSPATADDVEWSRGNYTLVERGGRVDSSAGGGALKKQVQMVAEGSVLFAGASLCGAAPNVAPEGFAHPVFRAGFALAIPLPEVS